MWKSVIERVERKWIPLPLVPADMNQPLVKSMWLCRDRMKTDMIFVTSSTSNTSSANEKYFWIWVKLNKINALALLEGKGVKTITQEGKCV